MRFAWRGVHSTSSGDTLQIQMRQEGGTQFTTANQLWEAGAWLAPDTDTVSEISLNNKAAFEVSNIHTPGAVADRAAHGYIDVPVNIPDSKRPFMGLGHWGQIRSDSLLRSDFFAWWCLSALRPIGFYCQMTTGNIAEGRFSLMVAT